jgi:hypothetical protein
VSTPRRQLTTAVAACVLGAAIALLTAGRTWRVVAARGVVPLPNDDLTGSELLPWLPAVALVGLAGAGALLATRGVVRAVIGGLLVVSAVPMVAAGAYGAATATGGRLVYPVLVGVGGLLVGYAGVRGLRRGASWPALGSRYERPSATEPVEYVERSGPSRSDVAMWDALDRGEDPTARG